MTVRVLLEPPTSANASGTSVSFIRWALLVCGLAALGYAGFGYLDGWLYQAREDEIIDRAFQPATAPAPSSPTPAAAKSDSTIFEPGLVGRIRIPRVKVRAVVKKGVDSRTLRRAVGHIPGTVLPGEIGNSALAAHRDTFFRGLKDIRTNDVITFETFDREIEYVVESLKVVGPKDVSVLAPSPDPVLTLVTCYPFDYIGNAPKRFIVRARQVSARPRENPGS